MKKPPDKFGNLSLDDITAFVSILGSLNNARADIMAPGSGDFAKIQAQLPPDFSWSLYYELPVQQFLILILATTGSVEFVVQAYEKGGNLLQHMLGETCEYLDGKELDWDGGHQGQFSEEDVIALMFALRGCIDGLRSYGRYLNHMVADVREGRDPQDKAFFDVLRIDPTAIGCPSFTARLSRGYMQSDTNFMNDLQLALVGKPHSALSDHGDLRLVLQLMHEAESLEAMKSGEAEALFIQELKLYTTQGDSKRSLMRFIQRWLENQRGDMKPPT